MYFLFNTDLNHADTIAPASVAETIDNQMLAFAAGILFEQRVFGNFDVNTACSDFEEIEKLNRSHRLPVDRIQLPALTGDPATGVPFGEALIRRYGATFPTAREAIKGVYLHNRIVGLLPHARVLEGHRIVPFSDVWDFFLSHQILNLIGLYQLTRDGDRLPEFQAGLRDKNAARERPLLN